MTAMLRQAELKPLAPLPPLADYKRDIHSQFGEDGIIEEIFRRLGGVPSPMWCVEFGAWDGIHLSNTRRYIEDHGARAVLIEADPDRHAELVKNTNDFEGVTALRRMVAWSGADSIYKTLHDSDLPEAFDLLSIDVDGHDYWIWHSLTSYRATVVVIEYNQTIPYKHVYVPPYDPSKRHGASLQAITNLGKRKGYRLAAVTDVNAILVDEDRFNELSLGDTSIDALTDGLEDYRTMLFQTMDGTLEIIGRTSLVWHQTPIDRVSIQTLPKWLRAHPDELGPIRKWMVRQHTRRALKRLERGAR